MLITIDGYSCQGKSYIGKRVADGLGIDFFSTGSLVRFVAAVYGDLLHNGIIPDDAIKEALKVLTNTDMDSIRKDDRLDAVETENYLEDIASYTYIMPTLQSKLLDYVKNRSILLDGRFTFRIFPLAYRKYYFLSEFYDRVNLLVETKKISQTDAEKYVRFRDSFEEKVEVTPDVKILNPFSFKDDSIIEYLIKDVGA